MDLDKYKPNSHKSKEEAKRAEKKVERVVTGVAKPKKKGELTKIKEAFISEDADNIKSYIKQELLIPSFKKLICDIVTDGISILLYGERGRSTKPGNASKISYGRFFNSPQKDPRPALSAPSQSRSTVRYDEYLIESKAEAEEVLNRMEELIENYEMASVADLCEMIGITCDRTWNKYGWTDIHTAYVSRAREGGYLLNLPKPEPLNLK